MSKLIATFFYVGYLRPASGTWGSAAAIPVAWVIHGLAGFWGLAIATVLAYVAGHLATRAHLVGHADSDPSEVVIDEVVGQWIALWPLSMGLTHAGVDPWLFPYPGWVGAFLMFRLFDIWKPGPIGWADRKHGATGVMLDDVFAGIAAGVVVAAAAAFSHGVLMQ
ncbi:MAG: phosphatidylglycerophosphatase A family protein [Brevirhabdus sp.]